MGEYLDGHLRSYDAAGEGTLTTKVLKAALADADLIRLTPIQMQSVLADAPVDMEGKVSLDAFVEPAARLITKITDPKLAGKRLRVAQMAKVTPIAALTAEEQERLKEMALTVFQTFDADGSGKLDRQEFHTCLTESKLGLSDRQIGQLMVAADESQDGQIDYAEFADLFYNALMEIARFQSVEKMMLGEAVKGIRMQMGRMLDELMIPLHLAFDLAAGGQEACPKAAAVDMLAYKCPEWGVPEDAYNVLAAAVMTGEEDAEDISWNALCALVEKLSMEAPEEGATGDAEAAPAPA